MQAKFRALFGNTSVPGGQFLWYSPNEGAQASNVPAGNGNMRVDTIGNYSMGEFVVLTNSSAHLYGVSTIASGNLLWIVTSGWIDSRGKASS